MKKISKYNAEWEIEDGGEIKIEMAAIRKGGRWKGKAGQDCGDGLLHHYKEYWKMIWGNSVKLHRWNMLLLEKFIAHKIIMVFGPQDSSKTNTAALWALSNYYLAPNNTAVIISSIDLKGLKLRIWAEIVKFHGLAKKKHEWLPGNFIESEMLLTTDQRGGARDFRKGVIALPCFANGKWIGVEKFAGLKQDSVIQIGDECFPAGTLVDTPEGTRPIETFVRGDLVISADGPRRVRGAMNRIAGQLLRISTRDGREIICTPNHRFFTQLGWEKACELHQSSYMMSVNETLRILQPAAEQTMAEKVLQSVLLGEMEIQTTRLPPEVLHRRKSGENIQIEPSMAYRQSGKISSSRHCDAQFESGERGVASKGVKRIAEGDWAPTKDSRRKRNWTNQSGENITGSFLASRHFQLSDQNKTKGWKRLSNLLQGGRRFSGFEAGSGGGWGISQSLVSKRFGREENKLAHGAWVDRVEVYEPPNSGGHTERERGTPVYNLEIEGHPSYCVNGFVAHNCQAMSNALVDGISGFMNRPEYKFIGLANPDEPMGPEGRLGEPADADGGWAGMPEPERTQFWNTRFTNGVCVNLVGTDSPNFDPETKDAYPFLIKQSTLDEVAAFWGKDSKQWYQKCKGVMKAGLEGRRVITRAMCVKFGALEEPVWGAGKIIKLFSLDAAYGSVGGDRCIGNELCFGENVQGRTILAYVNGPLLIPVSVANKKLLPEEQIATWVMEYCLPREIPPAHVAFDSTGRGTLMAAFARLWSPAVQGIEFGGKATDRPVMEDLFITEHGSKRKKRCDEHYSKFVTELWYFIRYAIENGQFRGLPEEVMMEGCLREWRHGNAGRIEVEPKEDTKERMGRSPDMFDALVAGGELARRLGFTLQRFGNKASIKADLKWLDSLMEKQRAEKERGRLVYG